MSDEITMALIEAAKEIVTKTVFTRVSLQGPQLLEYSNKELFQKASDFLAQKFLNAMEH